MTPNGPDKPNVFRRFSCVAAFLLLLACDRAPSDGVREWKATDHDQAQSAGMGDRVRPRGPAGGAAGGSKQGEAAGLADLAWRNQCASCHGVGGRGDGPTGPMVGAPDLTSAALQGRMHDADIVSAIKNGKGKMPKFDLPDDVVAALVVRVRLLGVPGGGGP
ncbi:MAG: cytochrome c [Polyangiaceae bacterium]